MNAEEIRNVIKRREEMWNSGNFEFANEIFARDIVSHESDGDHHGLKDFTEQRQSLVEALPDLQMEYSQIVIGDDRAAYVWTITGTHEGTFEGPFGPQEGTGKKVVLSGALNSRFNNGKIVEEWVHLDRMQFMEQLSGIDFDALFQRMGSAEIRQEEEAKSEGGEESRPSL